MESATQKALKQNTIMISAHHHYCGNIIEDANRWGFEGVEIYSHVCHWLNGKGDVLTYWESILKKKEVKFYGMDGSVIPKEEQILVAVTTKESEATRYLKT